jgi:hypothetical protein
MNTWRKLAGLIGAATVCALAAGCGGGDTTAGSASRQFGFEFALTTPKAAFSRGEQVPFTFTVKNTTNISIVTTYPTSSIFMMQATLDGQVKWFDPQGGFEPKPLTYVPGETKTFNVTWPQTDINGVAVPVGVYTVAAWVPAISINGTVISPQYAQANLAAAPIQITLQP